MKNQNTEQVERGTTDTRLLENGAAPTQAGIYSTLSSCKE